MTGRKCIFQIGFSRCGTTSLSKLFHGNGIPSIHWDEGRIAQRFKARMAAGEDPFADYPDTVFFSDMGNAMGTLIEPYKDFRYIHQFYPDSYFILNIRDVQNWLASRANHWKLVEWQLKYLRLTTVKQLLRYWEEDWHRHIADVRDYFADKPGRMIEFNIETDDPEKLAQFLKPDFAIDPRHYGHANAGKRKRYGIADGRIVKLRNQAG